MIIGIDCTQRNGTISFDDGRVVRTEPVSEIPSKMKKKNINISNIEKILITLGPGSFTSLRVGLSIAQGISFFRKIPIIGFSSFRAMVQNTDTRNVIPLLYARKDTVYAAYYINQKNHRKEVFINRVMNLKELVGFIKTIRGEYIIFGEGAEKNRELIEKSGFKVSSMPMEKSQGLQMLYRQRTRGIINPDIPLYVTLSEATRKRKKESLKIREMKADDIEKVMEIEKDVFPEPWDEDVFYYSIVKDSFISVVGIQKNKVAAYMIGQFGEEKFHLMNLAVSRKYWREGYGTAMIGYLIDILKRRENINTCYLELRINNHAAFELYKNSGFRVKEIRENYYSNNNDAIVMELRIG